MKTEMEMEHEAPQPHDEWAVEEVERRRKAAYADPESGSDRYFVEAQRKRKIGLDAEADALEQRGADRADEIRAELRYPEADQTTTTA